MNDLIRVLRKLKLNQLQQLAHENQINPIGTHSDLIRKILLGPVKQMGGARYNPEKLAADYLETLKKSIKDRRDKLPANTNLISYFNSADPSPNGEFTEWIIKGYLDQGIVRLEDLLTRVKPALENYLKLRQKKILSLGTSGQPWTNEYDLNNFIGLSGKTTLKKGKELKYPGLEDLLEDYQKELQELLKKVEQKTKAREGARVFFENDLVTVIEPQTHEAACHYGQGTRWCTASRDYSYMFNTYYKRGPLRIILPKKPEYVGEKYQYHHASSQYMNEKDQEVDPAKLFSKYKMDFELKSKGVLLAILRKRPLTDEELLQIGEESTYYKALLNVWSRRLSASEKNNLIKYYGENMPGQFYVHYRRGRDSFEASEIREIKQMGPQIMKRFINDLFDSIRRRPLSALEINALNDYYGETLPIKFYTRLMFALRTLSNNEQMLLKNFIKMKADQPETSNQNSLTGRLLTCGFFIDDLDKVKEYATQVHNANEEFGEKYPNQPPVTYLDTYRSCIDPTEWEFHYFTWRKRPDQIDDLPPPEQFANDFEPFLDRFVASFYSPRQFLTFLEKIPEVSRTIAEKGPFKTWTSYWIAIAPHFKDIFPSRLGWVKSDIVNAIKESGLPVNFQQLHNSTRKKKKDSGILYSYSEFPYRLLNYMLMVHYSRPNTIKQIINQMKRKQPEL